MPSQKGCLQHLVFGAFSMWSRSHFACQISQLGNAHEEFGCVCISTFIQTFSMLGGAAQTCQLEEMLLRIELKSTFLFFFFLFPGIYAWLRGVGISHFSCPFRLGLQDWSSEKGQSQCFNWSSIPAETTLRLFVCFPWKKLQVAMHSIPNLPSHLQQKDGGESTPAGAQQKLLGCSYASLCSEPSLMGASQLFLISADVDWSDPHQKSKQ